MGSDMKARVRTNDYSSKLHLVDLAGEHSVSEGHASAVGVVCEGCIWAAFQVISLLPCLPWHLLQLITPTAEQRIKT